MLKGSCSWPARNRKGGPPVPATASAGFLPARRWGRPLLEEDGGRRGRAVHVWLPRGVLELTSDGGAATRLLVVLGAPLAPPVVQSGTYQVFNFYVQIV